MSQFDLPLKIIIEQPIINNPIDSSMSFFSFSKAEREAMKAEGISEEEINNKEADARLRQAKAKLQKEREALKEELKKEREALKKAA